MTRVDFTLRGEQAERFLEIREQIAEERGYPPPKTEVLGRVLEDWDQ